MFVEGVPEKRDVSFRDLFQDSSGPKIPLPKPKAVGEHAALSTCGRFWAIPASFFGDKQWMLFLCLFFGVATQAFAMAGGTYAKYIPYFGLVSSPLYLVHAMRGTARNFKMLDEARKTKQVGESLFYLLLGISSLGTAFGDITKPFTCGVQIAGLSHHAACALIFGKVLPIVMIAAGSVSGLASAAELWRTQAELNRIKKTINDADFQRLEELFQEIRVPGEDELAKTRRLDLYFSGNKKRDDAIIEKFKKHHFNYSCPLKDVVKPQDEPQAEESPNDLLHQVKGVLHKVITDDATPEMLMSLLKNVEQVMDQHETLFVGEDIAAFKQALQDQKSEIERMNCASMEVFEDVQAQMHRNIAGHAIMLFLAVLTVVGGMITLLKIPHNQMVGSIMVITGCMVGMGNVLFDKFVTHEQYLKMDRWLYGRLKKTA